MMASEQDSKLSIVIPALNEADSIGAVLEQVRAVCGDTVGEIVVVDDGSTDGTGDIARDTGATVIAHRRNKGYGAALKTGIKNVHSEYVLTLDADGQYQAEDILRLWDAASNADMVSGHRTQFIHSSLWRMPGKWLLKRLAAFLSSQKIPDLNSGLRIYRTDVVRKYMHICPMGFSFSTTMLMAMLCRGYDVAYVPVDVKKRQGRASTVSVGTGFETVLLILRMAALFNPLKLFLPLGILSMAAGLGWGIPYIVMSRGLSSGAMLAMFTGVMLFALGLICDQISQLRLERFE